MPELPEVEITRQGITPAINHQRLEALILGKPLRWPLGCDPKALVGKHIQYVGRRGKYLLLVLQEGGVLAIHLGMSGSLRVLPKGTPAGPHDHADLVFSDRVLRLHDPRRFGAIVYADHIDANPVAKLLSTLGQEPLSDDFTTETLVTGLRGRTVSIKQALLSGSIVVGVGNIYASEALFMAKIHPATPAGKLGRIRLERLRQAIVTVLQNALKMGGSSLKDFVAVDGSQGHFQLNAHVYGRQGAPCLSCGTPIKQITQGQRSTYFCPTCQKR